MAARGSASAVHLALANERFQFKNVGDIVHGPSQEVVVGLGACLSTNQNEGYGGVLRNKGKGFVIGTRISCHYGLIVIPSGLLWFHSICR